MLYPTNNRLFATSIVLLALLLAALMWLYNKAQPVPLPAPQQAKLDCVSYAPFRRSGDSPLDATPDISPARIEGDLRMLAPYTDCVRTYSVSRGLEAVPAIAAKLGKKVLLGIWIGRDPTLNQAEIARGLKLARLYPKHIEAIIVGNEVLLRREQTADKLADLIAQVQAATDIPVTYADVWEFWLANLELGSVVDFVTIHVLPYWEDHPVAVERAVAHVRDTVSAMATMFPRHELLLGETGWPSAGRMRGPARPGTVEQARFTREWVQAAAAEGIRYNFIEAFDQPWKRQLEGAMGGHWGILNSDGAAKFDWHKPVVAYDLQRPAWLAGVACALLAIAAVVLLRARLAPFISLQWALLTAAMAGAVAGVLLPLQWRYLTDWNRDALEWAFSGAFVAAGLIAAILLTPILASARTLPGLAGHRFSDPLVRLWSGLRAVLLFGAAFFILLHAFDARYRGYPLALYVLPALALLLPWFVGLRVPATAVVERLLGLVILLGLVPMARHELPDNTQALGLLSLAAVMGLAAILPARDRVRAVVDARMTRPSNPPKAPGSTA